MTLYEISSQYQHIINLMDNEEIPEEAIADTIESIQAEFNDKADNIACVIKNLKAEAESIKAESKRLAERAKAKENKIEYLKAYLSSAMQVNNIDKIETVRNVIKFSKSSAVETSDNFIEWAETNAKDLLRVKTEADKTTIKSAIQEGKVPEEYAKIVEKKNLQIK